MFPVAPLKMGFIVELSTKDNLEILVTQLNGVAGWTRRWLFTDGSF